MAVYLIANINVTNPEGFKAYSAQVPALVAKHGGRYLVRGGNVDAKEGGDLFNRVVVIEFPNRAAANAFYGDPEYQPVLAIRLANAEGHLALISGVDEP